MLEKIPRMQFSLGLNGEAGIQIPILAKARAQGAPEMVFPLEAAHGMLWEMVPLARQLSLCRAHLSHVQPWGSLAVG